MARDRDQDTICAQSTPSGVGGISVIRISGSCAQSIVRLVCSFFPEAPDSHRSYYGVLQSASREGTRDSIDEVIATYFRKGRSFTGEDTVEISCHGSPEIVREIISELIASGARAADRGEFTYRAFMNGRLDLVQAESVLSLIESQSKQSAKQALKQLQGGLSQVLSEIEDGLVWCLAHIEASIDFSTEGLEVVDGSELRAKLESLSGQVEKLVESHERGLILRDGFDLVLTGVPNVGKSSLLNSLVGEERAIVTDVPGTTRDLVEGSFMLRGFRINVTDTAGLRATEDRVERIGIERSYVAQKGADCIFFVFDSSQPLSAAEVQELAKLDLSKVYLIGNKKDSGTLAVESRMQSILSQISRETFTQVNGTHVNSLADRINIVSAFDREDTDLLKGIIGRYLDTTRFEDQAVIFQARHRENLARCVRNLRSGIELVGRGMSPELAALELKEALLGVQETLGKRFDDEILDRVFKEFCLGK
jgi:tRNA modification GTPase